MNSSIRSGSKWQSLSPTAQMIILVFAGTPVWKLYGFTEPDPQVLCAAVSHAWERSGFTEADLKEPERVFPVLKDFVRESLRVQ
jgi:hypothetical protein